MFIDSEYAKLNLLPSPVSLLSFSILDILKMYLHSSFISSSSCLSIYSNGLLLLFLVLPFFFFISFFFFFFFFSIFLCIKLQMALQQCSTELSDILGTDASTGPAVWRVVALSTLSSVLTSLGPSRDQQSAKLRGE